MARRRGGQGPITPASAIPLAVRGVIVSAALHLSDPNKRCTMACLRQAELYGVAQRGGDLPARSGRATRPPTSARCRQGSRKLDSETGDR